MKKHLSKLALLFVGSIVFFSVIACSDDSVTSPDSSMNNAQMSAEMEKIINEIALSELTESEKNELLFMREEEKLARDVNKYLYSKWNQRTFTNISNSEKSTHEFNSFTNQKIFFG